MIFWAYCHKFSPKFVKKKQDKLLGKEILEGFNAWRGEIESRAYPATRAWLQRQRG